MISSNRHSVGHGVVERADAGAVPGAIVIIVCMLCVCYYSGILYYMFRVFCVYTLAMCVLLFVCSLLSWLA